MVSVLSMVVARRDGDAALAHAPLRQAGHQPLDEANARYRMRLRAERSRGTARRR